VTDGVVSKETLLPTFEARSIEVNEENNEIYIGDSVIYIITSRMDLFMYMIFH
jgi:hypothetical protein